MEEKKELGIPFLQADDGIKPAGGGFGEPDFTAAMALGRVLGENGVAMRTGAAFAEAFAELGFKGGGDGVFKTLGLFVDFVPSHAEDLAQHAFDEMVADSGMVGGLPAQNGETDDAVIANLDIAVALEPLERHGHGRRGNLKPVGEHGGDDLMALGFGFKDGFEVVLFGDVDGVFHKSF
jgi:hypothetical protein